ncbi:hypothetical protein WR25_16145 [Diploscapter pachys]|uniref:EGF-like domain-containing protein n=1 Tax=Diploscapter pachys TaxID=2018661 RepID=A0A2A2L997_9BILA|nr:hypothetical protein WR25_16145 [Diploscapter pachys]
MITFLILGVFLQLTDGYRYHFYAWSNTPKGATQKQKGYFSDEAPPHLYSETTQMPVQQPEPEPVQYYRPEPRRYYSRPEPPRDYYSRPEPEPAPEPYQQTNQVNASRNTVTIEVFGEGRCPDTTRFLAWHLGPTWNNYQDVVPINVIYHPFGLKSKCSCNEWGDYKCDCHHGERECKLNQLQACVIDQFPDPKVHMTTVVCIQGKKNIDEAGDRCIYDEYDRARLMNCALGNRGKELLSKHGKEKEKKVGMIPWVPWILIDGVRVKEAEKNLWQVLCDKYLHPRPSECPTGRMFA